MLKIKRHAENISETDETEKTFTLDTAQNHGNNLFVG